MHTKTPLMAELPKMCRSMNKRLDGAPHEVWMVLDASLGQNAIIQARQFNEVVPITGIVITKLDGSSKAGFLFSVRAELNVPILFTGLGEGEDDLVPFKPEEFVDALFEGSEVE
jgi:fused signal recognition particle receptor